MNVSSNVHHPKYNDHFLEYSFKSNPEDSMRNNEPFKVFCRKANIEKIRQSLGESPDEWDLSDFEKYKKEAAEGDALFDSIIAEFRINCVMPGNNGFEDELNSISEEYEKDVHTKIIPLDCRGGNTYVLQHIFDQTHLNSGPGILSFYSIIDDGLRLKQILKKFNKQRRTRSAY